MKKTSFLLLFILFSCTAGNLKISGTLGQTQHPEKPADFLEANGIVAAGNSKFWTSSGDKILCFSRTDRTTFREEKNIRNPYSVHAPRPTLSGDGERIYFRGKENRIYSFDPNAELISIIPVFSLPDARNLPWKVAPVCMKKGFGAKGKFFRMTPEKQIMGYDASGKELGCIFTIPNPPKNAKWKYVGFGFEPSSGDLLLASDWPDYRVYRFTTEAKQITDGGWPRNVWNAEIVQTNANAWATSNLAIELAPAITRQNEIRHIRSLQTNSYVSGVAEDEKNGDLLLSAAQGILLFDKNGTSLNTRLGGLPAISTIALDADGTVLAVHHGELILRFLLDDESGTPFQSGANEPWRIGGQWSHRTAGILPAENGEFFIADQTAGQIWKFNPKFQAELKKAWKAETKKNSFPGLSAFAFSGSRFWVLEKSGLREGNTENLETTVPTNFPAKNFKYLAAVSENLLIAADSSSVQAFERSSDGKYVRKWKTAANLGNITGIAADREKIVVTDAKFLNVQILSPKSGEPLAVLNARSGKENFSPRAPAISGNFILIADSFGKRILRLLFDSKG